MHHTKLGQEVLHRTYYPYTHTTPSLEPSLSFGESKVSTIIPQHTTRHNSSFSSLPLDYIAEEIKCMQTTNMMKVKTYELEEKVVTSRFTGIACIEAEDGSTAIFIVGDGVLLGGYYHNINGLEKRGYTALEAILQYSEIKLALYTASINDILGETS